MSIPLHESFALTPPPGEDDLPYSDGEPVDSEIHAKQQTLLVSSLGRAWEARDDFYVGGNMFVYYSLLQTKKNDFRGPDVFVVLDTTRRVRKSWVVWGEGGRTPDVVIELLSETTEHVDRGDKMRIYAKLLHVSNYYLFDPLTGVLEGYTLDTNRRSYVRMPAEGDLPCPALGLRLGVRHGLYQGVELDWLRWLDADGRPLPTDEELARAAEAEARAARAEARAARAEARAAEQREAEQAMARQDADRRLAEALAEVERLKASPR
jgi:Uma2 family endonuclease